MIRKLLPSWFSKIFRSIRVYATKMRCKLYSSKLNKLLENEDIPEKLRYYYLYLLIVQNPSNYLQAIKSILRLGKITSYLSSSKLHTLLKIAVLNQDPKILLYLLTACDEPEKIITRCSLWKLAYKKWGNEQALHGVLRVMLCCGGCDSQVVDMLLKDKDKKQVLAVIAFASWCQDVRTVRAGPRACPLWNKRQTLADYIYKALYSPNGFYSTGVKFARYTDGGDFITPTTSCNAEIYASHFVDLAFAIWKESRKNGDQEFRIVEIGGGDGTFACNFLAEAEKRSNKEFFNSLKYKMLELSSILQEKQRNNTKSFQDKVEVYTCDAFLGTADYDCAHKASMVMTHELLDAFPPQKFKKINGKIHICYIVEQENNKFAEEYLPVDKVKCPSSYREVFAALGEGDFVLLQNLRSYAEFLQRLISSKFYCIVNVDYGYENTINHDLRTYAKELKYDDNNPYTYPGKKDITFDNHLPYICAELTALLGETGCRQGKDWLMRQHVITTMSQNLKTPTVLECLVAFGSREFFKLIEYPDADIKRALSIKGAVSLCSVLELL